MDRSRQQGHYFMRCFIQIYEMSRFSVDISKGTLSRDDSLENSIQMNPAVNVIAIRRR